MKVLMLGWEFPPFFAGGAGIVCKELTSALTRLGVDITYIMPYGPDELLEKEETIGNSTFRLLIADNIIKQENKNMKIHGVKSILQAYTTSNEYTEEYKNIMHKIKKNNPNKKPLYGTNLKEEVMRFAAKAQEISEDEEFDIIHAQDWVTFPAAMAIKEKTGKPMVVHMHITEFDKTGGKHADPDIYAIEKKGMEYADRVFAVSQKVKDRCINQYYINPDKIVIVHNAATAMDETIKYDKQKIAPDDKIVLFAGRVTLQKGPDYFVDAAKKVLEHEPKAKFIIAGTGDMLPQIIKKVADMGMSERFMFTGFYSKEEGEKLFSIADVYIMPSVSEPFGIIPYEAMQKNTPTIVTRQTGISEVLINTLKVDFWNINEMAAKIIAIIKYTPLHHELTVNGYKEAKQTTWEGPATKCLNIYKELGTTGVTGNG